MTSVSCFDTQTEGAKENQHLTMPVKMNCERRNTFERKDTFDMGPSSEFGEVSNMSKAVYSQGLVNISLLSANATQLRSVQAKDTYEYQTTVIALISTSIAMQSVILILLIVLAMAPRGKVQPEHSSLWKYLLKSRLKSLILFLVSMLTAVNIFISTYHND